MAPGGVGDKPARVCGRLVRSQSLDLISFNARSAPRNGRESVTGALWRGRNSLAVELAYVEFEGAHCAPEDGNKPSERSFSGEKRA